MTAVSGVNALVKGETLTFGPELTVIYGPNGAGKFGYARVLKSACFTRSKETGILGDVRLEKHKQPKPSATFAFDDGFSTTFVYEEPCPRLRDNFAVFDSTCVRVHLDERNAFQVMSYLFDVSPRMVEAFGRLQRKLRDEVTRRSPTTDKFAIQDSNSPVATAPPNLGRQAQSRFRCADRNIGNEPQDRQAGSPAAGGIERRQGRENDRDGIDAVAGLHRPRHQEF